MKEKKKNKRLTKNKLAEMLQNLFVQHQDKTLSFKQIFKELHLVTHPAKMLAVQIMEDMAWDDILSKVSDNSYKLNLKGQVQEGKFIRKHTQAQRQEQLRARRRRQAGVRGRAQL